jgi:DNA end-binding protein Ku
LEIEELADVFAEAAMAMPALYAARMRAGTWTAEVRRHTPKAVERHGGSHMPRAIWKGAISFGLVNIPVSLYSASVENQIDLDMIDKRDFAPVGYRRVNKRTGRELKPADIVKGYEYSKGRYVVVSEEDMRQANVKATQTVDIFAFVKALEVPPYYLERPYYLEPGKRGEKGYALLREVLERTGKVGLGTVVLHTRQHLALLIPLDRMLLLNTVRYDSEIRPRTELKLPGEGLRKLGVSARELEMAERLVQDMTETWDPDRYHDTYRDDLMARVRAKIKAGKTHELAPTDEAGPEPRKSAQVIDLMALLKRSLDARGSSARGRASSPSKTRARSRKTRKRA